MENRFQLQNPKNNFNKSFTELRRLPLTLTQITLIEFVLSYTNNNQDCYASSRKIGEYLMISDKAVNNLISKMVKLGYIFTDTNSTFNKKKETFDGKTRYISINFELINSKINADEVKSSTENETSIKKVEVLPVVSLPTERILKNDDATTVNCFQLLQNLNCFSIGDLYEIKKQYRKTNITLTEAIQGIEGVKGYNAKYPKMPPMPELPADIIERITEKFNELAYETAC